MSKANDKVQEHRLFGQGIYRRGDRGSIEGKGFDKVVGRWRAMNATNGKGLCPGDERDITRFLPESKKNMPSV